ncbi:fimbria/pilus outer membrane usher protein [Dyella sp. C9]|uniref:fimbria/pilus outer membrane usher protein n=1 Tax=Dyella sp. C9 TaxID=2202154 RepID=UPI000DF0103F|nr:fimbria/pilus outer membrane usher protein [Dyella sp. C9]
MNRLRASSRVAGSRGHAPRGFAPLWLALSLALASHGAIAAPAAAAAAAAASGADANFDRSLLSGSGANTTDLSRFEHGNPVLPGNYYTDVTLNGSWVTRTNVRFAAPQADANASACVDDKLLQQLGLHPVKPSDELTAQLKNPAACVDIGTLIPGATVSFDMSELKLDVSVPQAYMGQRPRGYVSPEYWDAGIPAALLNYNFNSYRSTNNGQSQTTAYLGINAGLNFGPWHLREESTATWQSATAGASSQRQWQNINTYLQRDLPSWRAQLTVGDSFTDGQVFDSYGIRGVQLATDDRMLPDSLRGYAPVIRGVADTNALVTIRQNGMQIYQTTVAPGPFSINDLYPTGYGGSLDVTITEADGRTRTFSVPYASVAQLLRPGITRFSIVAGQLRNTALEHKPNVFQATVQHGFTNVLTGYAGLAASDGYGALIVGSAVNTRLGAVAVDVTQSRAEIPGQSTQSGQSYRVSYSKLFPESDTSLTVAAYRYSTSGYLSLSDAALARDYARRGLDAFTYVPPTVQTIDGVPVTSVLSAQQNALLSGSALSDSALNPNTLERQRNRFDLTMTQRLGTRGGSFYVNASTNDYWNRSGTNTQFQLGYNNTFHRLSYNFSATRTRDVTGRYDNQYFVTLSLPLGDHPHSPTLMLNLSHDATDGSQEQALLNGTLGKDNQFDYGVMASHTSSQGEAGSLSGGYRSPYVLVNASYGTGQGYSQASIGASGSVVAHQGGVTFGQPLGDTVGLVYAPDATGARVLNGTDVRVDGGGYAIVPYLSPYLLNTVQLDPKGLPLDVQLDSTSAQVAPHAGAVVLLKFKTHNGRSVIIRARLENGDPVPFGAEVLDEKGTSLGVVGQAGGALVRGVPASGTLTARWQDTDGNDQSCVFPIQLAAPAKGDKKQSYQEINVTCARPTTVAQVVRSGP